MTPLKLICFPGAPNLPIFAALEHGYFEDAGLAVELTTTPNSVFQIEQLMAGAFDIAGTAWDNVVAYREGQGAVAVDNAEELFAFMGATQLELALVVQPDIEMVASLKGRSLALDALATGFAFILYKMLEDAGLDLGDCEMVPVGATPDRWASVRDGTHAATLTIEPFTSIARAQGFNVVATSADVVPAYQGGSFATRRPWAEANGASLSGFVAGYLKGLAWVLDPANRNAGADMLLRNMPAINPKAVGRVMDKLLAQETGLTPGGAFLPEGMATVLALRSRYAEPKKSLADPSRYIDTRWLDAG